MADLKAGSTVGGLPIWHQGTMPLVPAGNSLTYKGYKVYTTNDKPQAADNDFVSKANGGTYTGPITINANAHVENTFSIAARGKALNIKSGTGDNATFDDYNAIINSWWGLAFGSESGTRGATIVMDLRNGKMITRGDITTDNNVIALAAAPTIAQHLTRKDYVDGRINTVTSNANNRVLKSGDVMTGQLEMRNTFIKLTRKAENADQVPWLGQVIEKDVVIDFGTY